MSYSCSDFTDSILDALGIKVPEESRDNPAEQAHLAFAEIDRLQRLVAESETPVRHVERPILYVTMEGGICQGVSVDGGPDLVGMQYVTIDYDSEGADEDEITLVKQSDGDWSEAIIGGGQVDVLTVAIDSDGEQRDANDAESERDGMGNRIDGTGELDENGILRTD